MKTLSLYHCHATNSEERLDNTIADAIQQEEELETKICEADTYQTTLEEHIAFLKFVKRAIRPPQPTSHELPDESCESANLISNIPTHEPEVVSKPIHSTATVAATHESNETARTDSTYQNYSTLPKLALPTFSGNPLQWQTFWDSFATAVDNNPHLSGTQKFNYLRSQVQGDMAHVIDGFPLTDINYTHSVELLKEKYGQIHKRVNSTHGCLAERASSVTQLS